jgi:lambda family phage tail tape measure protein
MAAGTQTRRIVIKVDAPGVRAALDGISGSMGKLNANTKSLKDNVSFLRNSFLGFVGAFGVRELANLSDQMQNLGNRLKIVALEGEDTKKTFADIAALANRTNQSIGDAAEVYTRLASSLKGARADATTLLSITEALINSFRISGSTGNETTATIIQLSQAFASGTLRGQELRSVLLQNAELARLLRERFGGDLAKKAEAGLIKVTEVLKILRENQDRVNESAKILTPTFEQVLTKAVNRLQIALKSLNDEFNLSGKFGLALDAILNRFTLLAAILGVLALTRIPQLIASIKALGTASLLLVRANPLLAAFVGLSAAILLTNDSLEDFIDKIRRVEAAATRLYASVLEFEFNIKKSVAKGAFFVGLGSKSLIKELALDLDRIKELQARAAQLSTPTAKLSVIDPDAERKAQEEKFNQLLKNLEKLYAGGEKAEKLKNSLAEINKEYLRGSINIEQYNKKLVSFELYKLNREFAEGKFDIFQYNERLKELKTQELNRDFKAGLLTIEQFNQEVAQLQINNLTAAFNAGRISLQEFNVELAKVTQSFSLGGSLRAGTQSYIDSIGTATNEVAQGITRTFNTLEDTLVEFVKNGKINFNQFAQSVLDDLTRIIIRASILKPLAEGLLNAGVSAGTSTSTTTNGYAGGSTASPAGFAKGGMFDKGIQKFANGGIVSKPTLFNAGLMGEAGPEAILPLQRGKGGSLGVSASVTPVNIVINNNSSAQIQQTETTGANGEKTIEILVINKVREGIASGRLDKVMDQSYGLKRRGV